MWESVQHGKDLHIQVCHILETKPNSKAIDRSEKISKQTKLQNQKKKKPPTKSM